MLVLNSTKLHGVTRNGDRILDNLRRVNLKPLILYLK